MKLTKTCQTFEKIISEQDFGWGNDQTNLDMFKLAIGKHLQKLGLSRPTSRLAGLWTGRSHQAVPTVEIWSAPPDRCMQAFYVGLALSKWLTYKSTILC